MTPKKILITGATSGIGKAAAMGLARMGHTIVFTARDESKAISTRDELIKISSNKDIEFILADLSSLAQVKKLAEEYASTNQTLDVLINNAGVWEMERKFSADNIEMNFAVNHLAPFLLTLLLLPTLYRTKGARIINTSSMAHRRNILQLDDIEFNHSTYDGVKSYSQSKLCNLLFSLKLVDALAGTGVTVNTVHPGYVKSNLFKNMGDRDWNNVPDAADGARSTIFAATSYEMEQLSGKYIYHEREDQPIPQAYDKIAAQKVWDLSMAYVSRFL
ncbi:MAG: SDR family NAD(P)-dependent oxidoreductase [Bacteroidetes bacterium]|nr:SDR family NAD(P)-dependent oxidoreductase [Bacteroidota bacterium]